ncbi:N-6 DNA methylase [uncultured Tissierella sp.]|uniref:N-6 DNA methylase n=1 Tax=uncultured Tissierella sp. TaxID=448160 RepID=UPI0028055CB2|nr:N-6 DNA methylase [uncultured Tissierella sp.]MDU5080544.1 N-6 DNA methylase [Bacillota bacterium]
MKKEAIDMHRVEDISAEEGLKLLQDVESYIVEMDLKVQGHEETYKKKGFIYPYLFAYDNLLWGRWGYWHKILAKKTTKGSGSIPQIEFSSIGDKRVQITLDMLRKCLKHPEANINNFADWLLWGFGQGDQLDIPKELNKHYYENFDIFFLQDNPFDYFSIILEECSSRGSRKSTGYYSTPFDLAQLTYKLMNNKQEKDKTIYDGCVGCGALLLPASNYHLKAYFQDISLIALKLCLIQFIIYAPWFAFHPDDIELI